MIKGIRALTVGGLLAVLLTATLSCGGSGGGLAAAAKMVPRQTDSVTYSDVQQLRNSNDLRDLYDQARASWRDTDLAEVTGISVPEIDWYYDAYTPDGYIEIVGGAINLQDVRNELEDNGWDEHRYQGVEVWEDGYDSVAITNGHIIVGDPDAVEACVDVMKGDIRSMYDDSDVAAVIERLPSGLFSGVYSEDYSSSGAVASGMSAAAKNKYGAKVHEVFLFENDDDAEDAVYDIENDFGNDDYRNIDVSRRGRFVVVSGEMDLNDL